MQPSSTPIRTIIVDDHTLFRAGLKLILADHPGIVVVGETGNSNEAIALTERLQPDVILFETNLPGNTSLEIIPRLLEKAHLAKMILVTGNCDPKMQLTAIQKGVVGVIQKNQTPDILMKAIEKVHQGEVWIERSMMADVLSRMTNGNQNNIDPEKVKISLLSQRERQVLSLIGKGLKNRDIAFQLSISETTVSHHLTSIFNKLDVSDRLELVIFAYRYGLAKPPA